MGSERSSSSKECPAGDSRKDCTVKKFLRVLEKWGVITYLHCTLETRALKKRKQDV